MFVLSVFRNGHPYQLLVYSLIGKHTIQRLAKFDQAVYEGNRKPIVLGQTFVGQHAERISILLARVCQYNETSEVSH